MNEERESVEGTEEQKERAGKKEERRKREERETEKLISLEGIFKR